jgi:hypothetical protein
MYRVSDVLKPDFARSWHEAVAIVQAVADQLVPGATVPGPDDLLIDQNGSVQLGFGSADPQDPVCAVASLLQSLLSGVEAPVGLRELADDNSKPVHVYSTVESFQRALAFYERPGRADDLANVVGRLEAARETADSEEEFERLRERVGGTDEPAPEEQPQPEKEPARRQRRIAMAATALLSIVALIGASPRGRHGVASLSAGAATMLRGVVSTTPAAAGVVESSPPLAAAGGPAEAPAANAPTGARVARETVSRADAAPPRSTRNPVSGPRPDVGPTVAIRELGGRAGDAPIPPELVIPLAASVDPAKSALFEPPTRIDGVYSSADTGVEPPRFVRPQLPREPEPNDQTGYFDLIIDEGGRVEQVKLLSPTRQYREWMLLAAAKAWTFRPATLSGRPVKYNLRVAIILPGWQ